MLDVLSNLGVDPNSVPAAVITIVKFVVGLALIFM